MVAGRVTRSRLLVGCFVALLLIVGLYRAFQLMTDTGPIEQVQGIGYNDYYQLSEAEKSSRADTLQPIQSSRVLAGGNVQNIKAGHYFTLYLTRTGEVYAVGNATHSASLGIRTPKRVKFPELHRGETIKAIDASRDHSVALTSEGRVYAWGSNYTGQLGDGSHEYRDAPVMVEGMPKATQVAAGYRHSAAITETGDIYAWGGVCSDADMTEAKKLIAEAKSNLVALGGYGSTVQSELKSGDIGDCTTLASTFVQSKTPKKLEKTYQAKPARLSIGYGHVLVLTEDGKIYSAGCNTYKQLGRTKATGAGKNNLAPVVLPARAAHLNAGYRHSAVIMQDGKVFVWGYDRKRPGAESNDGSTALVSVTPTHKKLDQKARALEAAHDTTFVVTERGAIQGWGQDDAGAFWRDDSAVHTLGNTNAGSLVTAGMLHLLVKGK